MRQRANGDEIDAGGRDVSDGLQSDPSAGFELHFSSAEAHGFLQLFARHVIQKDYIDTVDGEKLADLLESLGFDFDPDTGMLKTELHDRGLQRLQSSRGDEMIVFDDHHVEETE